ncbi:MAG TPA: ABC transporter substrate-binding protein [Solirubrobacteraceae bacterium]|nr:ABC transporter substrate-binding protein [Solirubrobacteraceae bacterium]
MSRFPLLVSVAALALALAACGEKSEPAAGGPAGREPFTLVLDYYPNADHAPIYAAQASGEFRRAGLDVRIQTPPDPSAPLRLLQAGRADLAISYEPEVLLARDERRQIVSVGALVQVPLTSLMAVGGNVRSVRDLRGKTIGTAGIPYQDAYLETILEKAGIPRESVRKVDVGFNLIPAMLSKRVDATLGAFWNVEGVELERRGRKPTILRMEELGVPTYDELVFAARRQDLTAEKASRLRRFLAAVARGAALVRDDPARAADAIVKANPDLERGSQLASIKATLPAFFDEKTEAFGIQDETQWLMYGQWMREQNLLDRDPLADNAVTNEFLPGEGLQKERTEY